MPVTFDIYPEFIEAKLHWVDTIERAYEEKLLEEKWSRNKTCLLYTSLPQKVKPRSDLPSRCNKASVKKISGCRVSFSIFESLDFEHNP